jgi:hypothetical protein
VPADVATVNGVPIRASQYERALADLASDRRDGVDDQLRRHVLDRLIEEELLVQRGLALGLARTDRRVRGELTAAVIGSVLAGVEGEPSAAEIDAFYAGHADEFRAPGRIQVEQIFFGDRREDDARSARRRLDEGAGFDGIRAEGDPEPVPVPASPPPARRSLPPDRGAMRARAPRGWRRWPAPFRVGYHVVRWPSARTRRSRPRRHPRRGARRAPPASGVGGCARTWTSSARRCGGSARGSAVSGRVVAASSARSG